MDRFSKAILLQSHLQQTVIAAIEGVQVRPDDDVVNARYFADIGVEIDGIEITRSQATCSLA